jgi:glycine/D-amino acid oxidase-like deaminating enzyme
MLLPENREANLRMAYAAVPRLAELKIADAWVGLEGRSPDRYPFFGEVAEVPGFYVLACVHGGFTLGPLLGDQLAELIVEGRTTFDMRRYTCREFQARFARQTA